MNVLHILDHSLPIHSGYAFRSSEILRFEKSMGWHVTALTGPKHYMNSKDDAEVAGITYERAPYRNNWLSSIPIVQQLEVVRAIKHRIEESILTNPVDIIHAHSPSLNGLAALLAAKGQSIPIVYEMRASWEDAAVDHGTMKTGSFRYWISKSMETVIMKRANAVTTICQGLKKDICSRGIRETKVTVIPNAVDVMRFVPKPEGRLALRKKYKVEANFVVVFCGSFYAYEGLDLLLTAVAKLKSRVPQIAVLLAGGGEQEDFLKRMANNLGIASQVQFLGRVPQSSVIDIYNLADVCAFPRHRIKLTEMVTPLKPLEVMAAGTVVLASDVGGHKELIRDRVTGFLSAADSVKDLADSLETLTNDNSLDDVRFAAREFVCNEKTWKSSVSKYRDVYQKAIDEKCRKSR